VNYPWDRWSTQHADYEWFYSISRAWADTVHLYSEPGYMDYLDNGVTQGYDWYPVYGGRQDYVTYTCRDAKLLSNLTKTSSHPLPNWLISGIITTVHC